MPLTLRRRPRLPATEPLAATPAPMPLRSALSDCCAMSRPYISVELQEQGLADAGHLCGYCHSDERLSGIPLSIEHIIPRVADGPTARENPWRSCQPCNEQKGGQIAATAPETGELMSLYNQRIQPDTSTLDRASMAL